MVQTICPASNGTVVFTARNLYNNITGSNINFVDACNNENNGSRRVIHSVAKVIDTTKQIVDNGIRVYPNPTKGEVNIQLPSIGNWNIIATDVEGRVIWQQDCNGCEGIVRHYFNGSKGLYFIKIVNSTGLQNIKKITLQ